MRPNWFKKTSGMLTKFKDYKNLTKTEVSGKNMVWNTAIFFKSKAFLSRTQQKQNEQKKPKLGNLPKQNNNQKGTFVPL